MKKLGSFILALGLVLAAAVPAQARVFVGVGYGYYPYSYPYYYYPGYYPSYYAAPPVMYSPAPVTYVTPTVMPTPTLAANQTSPTFTDSLGRTCRQFQTTAGVGPAAGTACLMPNGTWQPVQ